MDVAFIDLGRCIKKGDKIGMLRNLEASRGGRDAWGEAAGGGRKGDDGDDSGRGLEVVCGGMVACAGK